MTVCNSLFVICLAAAGSVCHAIEPVAKAEVEAGKPGVKSSLIGRWADFGSLEGAGATSVRLLTIDRGGIFRSVSFTLAVDGIRDEEGKQAIPPGVEMGEVESGRIDLASGERALTEIEKRLQVVSVTFSAKDGVLSRVCDMGKMGTETIRFYRLADQP